MPEDVRAWREAARQYEEALHNMLVYPDGRITPRRFGVKSVVPYEPTGFEGFTGFRGSGPRRKLRDLAALTTLGGNAHRTLTTWHTGFPAIEEPSLHYPFFDADALAFGHKLPLNGRVHTSTTYSNGRAVSVITTERDLGDGRVEVKTTQQERDRNGVVAVRNCVEIVTPSQPRPREEDLYLQPYHVRDRFARAASRRKFNNQLTWGSYP